MAYNMDLLFKIFLIIHIVGGSVGLLAGSYVMFTQKGDKIHKLIGKIFAVSMLGAGMSALVLSVLHRNNFLFGVGVFTIYMAATGWRYLSLKKLAQGQKPIWLDWFLLVFMVLASIILVILGVLSLMDKEYFAIIVFLFAWRGVSFAWQDWKTYHGKINLKNYWLIFHLQRMTGAYIASLSAFLVVNFSKHLSFVPWLLPTIIFVPLIVKWTRKYKQEL